MAAGAVFFAGTLTSSLAQTIIGTGADASYLVIEAEAFGSSPFIYEYRYDYDPENPFDGYAFLSAIDAAVPEIEFSWANYGDETEPNYFLDSVSYLSLTVTSTHWPDVGPYWAQWVSGGQSGYPSAEPIASGVWQYGSGSSAPFRMMEPGAWEGFTFNEEGSMPSLTPIPESRGLALVAVGAFLLFALVRNRRENQRI